MERREDQGGYLVRLLPALEAFPQGDPIADATRINQVIEEQILRCPEQYFWLHRRFKKRAGLPAVYD
jgi:KDO2-lipid IV(A) lauroyltransferase